MLAALDNMTARLGAVEKAQSSPLTSSVNFDAPWGGMGRGAGAGLDERPKLLLRPRKETSWRLCANELLRSIASFGRIGAMETAPVRE